MSRRITKDRLLETLMEFVDDVHRREEDDVEIPDDRFVEFFEFF